MSSGERAFRRSLLYIGLFVVGIGLVFPEIIFGKITLVENSPTNLEGSPVYERQAVLLSIENEHGKDFVTLILTQESEAAKPELPEKFYMQIDRNGLLPEIGSHVYVEMYENGCMLVKYSESVSQGGSIFRRAVFNETKGTTVYTNVTCSVLCGCLYSQKTSVQKQESLIKFNGVRALGENVAAYWFNSLFAETITFTK